MDIQHMIDKSQEKKLNSYRTMLEIVQDLVDRRRTISIYAAEKTHRLSRAYFYDNKLARAFMDELRAANGHPQKQQRIIEKYRRKVDQFEEHLDLELKQRKMSMRQRGQV